MFLSILTVKYILFFSKIETLYFIKKKTVISAKITILMHEETSFVHTEKPVIVFV